jgi:hypothetical protein
MLLIKATGKWSRGQIPGKFFEYIGSRNPILCIGPQDSEVAEIIRAKELGYVVEDNQEEMLDVLRNVYRQFHQGGSLPLLQAAQADPFSSLVMVKKMYALLGSF